MTIQHTEQLTKRELDIRFPQVLMSRTEIIEMTEFFSSQGIIISWTNYNHKLREVEPVIRITINQDFLDRDTVYYAVNNYRIENVEYELAIEQHDNTLFITNI